MLSLAEGSALIDGDSAKDMLGRLQAHDGPSALIALTTMESRMAEFRRHLGRMHLVKSPELSREISGEVTHAGLG